MSWLENGVRFLADAVIEIDGANATPACLVCGARPTIRAHLIPESFIRQIQMKPKSGEQHLIIHPSLDYKQPSKTGRYEPRILCGPCDGKLGRYEEAALRLMGRLRSRRIGVKTGTESVIREKDYAFRAPDPDAFMRFACGILWKYASVSPRLPGYIDVGDYRNVFEDICFRGAPIPKAVDVGIERDLFSFAAFTDPNDVYYYQTPSLGARGTKRVAQLGWFGVWGFIVYVRFDEDGPSDHLPSRCWMRGREQFHFHVSMRSIDYQLEQIGPSIHEVKQDLNRLNGKILSRI